MSISTTRRLTPRARGRMSPRARARWKRLIESSRKRRKLTPEAKLEWEKLYEFSKDNPEATRSRELRELLKRYIAEVGRYSFRVGRS